MRNLHVDKVGVANGNVGAVRSNNKKRKGHAVKKEQLKAVIDKVLNESTKYGFQNNIMHIIEVYKDFLDEHGKDLPADKVAELADAIEEMDIYAENYMDADMGINLILEELTEE